MRKIIVLIIISTLLAACAPAATANAPLTVATAGAVTPAGPQVSVGDCSNVAVKPTPDENVQSIFPKVAENEHIDGPEGAPVTVIAYNDFQCPSCALLHATLKELKAKYGDQLRIVYRHFPLLTVEDKAGLATQAAEAAHRQGKFWEMHDVLFEKQAEWVAMPPADFPAWLEAQAGGLGLDVAKFLIDLNSPETLEVVKQAWEGGNKIGLPGAPLMLINGQIYSGPRDRASLDFIFGMIALGERQFSTCPQVVIDPSRRYTATLKTEKGDIVIRLYADRAPNTVNNFVFLAQNGWFDNITFHRVVPGFVAQTGDPSGTGSGNPGYFIENENDPTLKFDRPGLVGMANTGKDTNGSQFFITYAAAPHLDGGYTIFGEVVSGMDVLARLTPRDPQPGLALPDGDKLLTILIEEK
jgi:cyclophilin family peptidyl-prolyl cis-trans isomerase/protein-disulfide isomerase